jgi:1-acyl-sn-glycerol-3-phosphate acyltransferase
MASLAKATHPSNFRVALALVKGAAFYAVTFALAVPLFITMCVLAPFVTVLDPIRRRAQHWVNNVWAKVSTGIFYRVRIVGKENLPPAGSPAVYVANHQSYLDIYTLFHLDRPFKFISKTSNFLIPIIGWSMYLTGHVRLNRVDRRSQLKCLSECGELLRVGAPLLFFPEGTRSKDCVMADFKKGAFSVAAKAKVPVVPVTLVGTGALMPAGQEARLFGGGVTVVVHPPIPPGDAGAMMDRARAAITSALPPALRGEGGGGCGSPGALPAE